MKKKLIRCSLMLCCLLLVTAVGTAFAKNLGDEKNPNVVLVNGHYNTNLHVEKTKIKRTEPDDFLQGLIMAPSVIMNVFAENPSIVSSK